MPGLKVALRTLTNSPFVTAVAILSLALGIGANSAMFSLVDQMLMQALPVADPDGLVNFSNPGPKPGSQSCGGAGGCDEVFSYPMFKDLQAATSGFSSIAAHVPFGANLARQGETVSGSGTMVSGSYFPTLGVQPYLGRLLGPADDETFGSHFVAVLSYDYWRNRLGADENILNETLIVNGQSMTVVGVAAPGFTGTTFGSPSDVFVPITMRELMLPGWTGFERRRSYWAYLFGRLAPNTTLERAGAELNNTYRAIVTDVEAELQTGMSEAAMERFLAKELGYEAGRRGQSTFHGTVRTPMLLLMGITTVVLLIACANIANLLLARGAKRAQELAIRASIGASRRQLLRQLLFESVLLAVLGGIASLVVAQWTLSAIGLALPTTTSSAMELQLRPAVVLFAAALSLGTGLLFGLYPALHSTRTDLAAVLRSNSGQPAGNQDAARFRSALVVAQLALSTALLVAAGLFVKSLVKVSQVDLGLETQNVVAFTLSPELNGYEPVESVVLFERAEEVLAAIPGVTSVSAGRVAILIGNNWGNDVSVEGYEAGPDINSNARFNAIGADYFRTLGVPLIAGREFDSRDSAAGAPVVIVNQAFAEKFGLGSQAIGKRMADNGSGVEELDMEIVGVVQNAKYATVKGEVPPLFFIPYRQNEGIGSITFYAKTAGAIDSVLRAIPPAIAELDANLPVESLTTLEQQARDNVYLDRVISLLSTAFAVLATLLASIGLYGVLAYTVSQRTREIGVRMALGADRGKVRIMVLKQLGRMGLIGGAIGLVGALAIGEAAQSLLFEMSGNDPMVVVLSVLTLGLVAALAGYIPARRASRIDPMDALREG